MKNLISILSSAVLGFAAVPAQALVSQERETGLESVVLLHCFGLNSEDKFAARVYEDGLALRFVDEPIFINGRWHKASDIAADKALHQAFLELADREIAAFERIQVVHDEAKASGDAVRSFEVGFQIENELQSAFFGDPQRVSARDPAIRDWLVRIAYFEELGRELAFTKTCTEASQAKALSTAKAKAAKQSECMTVGLHRGAGFRATKWVCDAGTFNLN